MEQRNLDGTGPQIFFGKNMTSHKNMAARTVSEEEILAQLSSDNNDDDSDKDPNYVETSGESESENSDQELHDTEDRGRSRKRKRNKRQREINKERRDQGKSYVHTKTKQKVYAAKVTGPDCTCPKKCFQELGKDVIDKLFDGFWKLGNRDKQNAYIFSSVEVVHVKRKYGKKESTKRNYTVLYTVQSNDGKVGVCKKAFLSIHGLQNNRGRIDNIINTIKDGHCSPRLDRRGKHSNRANAYSDDQIEQVKEHIRSIPKYTSHYSRRDNPNRTYISMEYTILSCYHHYAEEFCLEKKYRPVSKDKYRRIFVEDFNIGIQRPKTDTCKMCDGFQVKLKTAEDGNDKPMTEAICKEQELHHRKAQAGQDNIQEQSQKAKAAKDNSYHVITFDLQQALPTPKLSTGPAFYKRKVWTYNLNVHDCKSGTGYCYVWDETVAGRGSEEVGSCLRKYIESSNIHGGTLVGISDNCGGQNKNWTIQFLWLYFLATGRFDAVEHHFPLSGHSMLPSDRDFAFVEKHVRQHVQYVYSPDHWREIITKSSSKLQVTEMKNTDFSKLTILKEYFTPRTKTTDGDPVNFKNVVRFRMTSENFGMIMTSPNFKSDVWNTVSVNRRGRPKQDVAHIQFPLKYDGPRALDKLKVADVMSLLNYIPPMHAAFFNSLKSSSKSDSESDTDQFCVD